MERLIHKFCNGVETVAALLIACVTLLIVASAIGRYLVASPVPDAFDISRLLLGACMMWGFAVVGYRGGHISVDIFTLGLPDSVRRWIEVFAWLTLLFFVALLVWKMQARVVSQVPSIGHQPNEGSSTTRLSRGNPDPSIGVFRYSS